MKISYSVVLDDMVALHRQAAQDSPSIQRNRRNNLWGGTIFLFALALFQAVHYRQAFYAGSGVIVSGAYFFFMRRYYERAWEKQIRRFYDEGSHQGVMGQHELEIEGDMLKDTTSVGCQSVQVKSLERICESPTHYFIFLSAVTAHAVPKAGVTGDLPGFMARLRKAKVD